MNILIDVNLSPSWVDALGGSGYDAVHWTAVGDPCATDREILEWARDRRYVVFTHDLDFGAILAATNAHAPSVIQIRTQNPTPEFCGTIIVATLKVHADALQAGALISVDEDRSRTRLLPL